MIVNSHPYNPSQQSQQQRCVGIDNQALERSEGSSSTSSEQLINRMAQSAPSAAFAQQQNSLYGSNLAAAGHQHQSNMAQHQQRSSHMFDLANLQQQQHQGSLFDSAYDDATSSLAAASQPNGNSDQTSHSNNMLPNEGPRPQQQHPAGPMGGQKYQQQQQQQQQHDVSLYSPSSSTSLLYHVYDQINLPADHQSQNNFKRSNTTTILNPANLFGATMVNSNGNNAHQQQQQQHQHQLTLPHHQITAASHQQQQQQQQQQAHNFGQSKTSTIAQQELYSGGAQFHLHQPSFNSALHHHHQHNNDYALDSHQMMLDTILRQQHAAATTARAQQYHNRPLSSSGASSMSGQSMALTYGRQPRAALSHLPPLPPINPVNKSLASVLQSNQTLNHLGLANNHGHATAATLDSRASKKLAGYPQDPLGAPARTSALGSRKWKRAEQRLRHLAYEYGTLLKCSILLILLAVFSMSIIKFASFNQATTSNQNQPHPPFHQQQQQVHPMLSQNSNIAQGNMNPLIYPPTKLGEPQQTGAELDFEQGNVFSGAAQPAGAGQAAPDVLKSKLLIGEFVVLSQNYSNSAAQRSLLAENIVKLMDQVFLSTEVRRVYSRMEVTNIRPHRPLGIVVDCNIILSDSIAYAAQQFGIALYESLAKSGERLASQSSFIIDKNSIRFNTVPDKDLGIVPPELIPPTFPREALASGAPFRPTADEPIQAQPSAANGNQQQQQVGGGGEQQDAESSVVWSEWSSWSSCVDKNGVCDAGRLHSRLRRCVAQHTGEKVEALQCRQRFNMQDLELEVADCSASCSTGSGGGGLSGADSTVMSDAPSPVQPQTAPSVLSGPSEVPPSFLLPPSLSGAAVGQTASGRAGLAKQSGKAQQLNGNAALDSALGASPAPVSSTERVPPMPVALTDLPEVPLQQQPQQQQQQMSCSNCTSDEICLMLVQQKVPFCAKIKDRQDESGCGGWCKAENQLCQPVGANAFKCIHDSECLPDEWRCDNSACIPLSKRCDGHSNCFDSSDERDCPNR